MVLLGFVVSAKGVQVDVEKVKAIQEWPTPKTVSEVRGFHGLASFFRRFVKDFSTLAAPLTEVVKNNVGFKWGKKQEEAFLALKHRLTNAPILAMCRNLPFSGRATRGSQVCLPRKEYARSRHHRLFEENVGKTGKDVVYEL